MKKNHYCYAEKNKEKIRNKNIIFGSNGGIQVRVEFDSIICEFFKFGLFYIWMKKIMFKTKTYGAF